MYVFVFPHVHDEFGKNTQCVSFSDECAAGPCKNGADCQDMVNGYTCMCTAGWTGVNCDFDIRMYE